MGETLEQVGAPKRRADRTPTRQTTFGFQLPASTKVYVPGTMHPQVRVGMREVALTPTRIGNQTVANAPFRI